jgi:hypothetical protein
LISQFQKLLEPNQLNPAGCAFFLDMNNWWVFTKPAGIAVDILLTRATIFTSLICYDFLWWWWKLHMWEVTQTFSTIPSISWYKWCNNWNWIYSLDLQVFIVSFYSCNIYIMM